jgi:hypothetical protein
MKKDILLIVCCLTGCRGRGDGRHAPVDIEEPNVQG